MNSEEGFLKILTENPDDDATRLVYADWLEELGEAHRAEFLRLSWAGALLQDDGTPGHEALKRQLAARKRRRTLRETIDGGWLKALGDPGLVGEIVYGGVYYVGERSVFAVIIRETPKTVLLAGLRTTPPFQTKHGPCWRPVLPDRQELDLLLQSEGCRVRKKSMGQPPELQFWGQWNGQREQLFSFWSGFDGEISPPD
jgi:uncharacterized protein (TIGR02996 family)